ncbi:MAG: DNA-processing protein DprA [Chloroflexota bacterium]
MKFSNGLISVAQHDPTYPRCLTRFLGEAAPVSITLRGNTDLLLKPEREVLAFFCSANTPASVLLAVQDLAHQWRDRGLTVISGFHSPAEKEVMTVLLRGHQPLMWVLARSMLTRFRPDEREAIENGRLLVISPFSESINRITFEKAQYRNRVATALADEVLIAYATPGSKTESLAREIVHWGKPMCTIENHANRNLIELGIRMLTTRNEPTNHARK